MDDYDVIIIGYPIWRGTVPMAVRTFLDSYDFSGKTIVPFSTHGGSGLGSSVRDITSLCPNSTILEGLAVIGTSVGSAQSNVNAWLDQLDILK